MRVMSARLPAPERITQARTEAALTQEELARRIPCSVNSVGKWERGERSPKGARLRGLAIATGKSLSWFFEEEEAVA
jgi:transcriptional regulator with XRE-family HTH domain